MLTRHNPFLLFTPELSIFLPILTLLLLALSYCFPVYRALSVAGDSMSPEFQPGDIIVMDPDILPATGKFVVVKIENGNGSENGEATFKQFVRDGNKIFLKPLNERYLLMDMTGKAFRRVGCVVQKMSGERAALRPFSDKKGPAVAPRRPFLLSSERISCVSFPRSGRPFPGIARRLSGDRRWSGSCRPTAHRQVAGRHRYTL